MQRSNIGRSRDGSSCCWSVCRCLAGIPCSSFCIFLALIAALIVFAGSSMIAFYRTRQVIDQPDIWPWFLYACIGVVMGMLVFAATYLTVASISGTRSYSTTNQNLCLRIFCYLVVILAVILQLAWIVLTITVAIPLVILLLFIYQYNAQNRVNLSHYGIQKQPVKYGDELTEFYETVQDADLLVCYSTSLVCSVVVSAMLGMILINTVNSYGALKVGKTKEFEVGGGSRPSNHSAHKTNTQSSETVI